MVLNIGLYINRGEEYGFLFYFFAIVFGMLLMLERYLSESIKRKLSALFIILFFISQFLFVYYIFKAFLAIVPMLP